MVDTALSGTPVVHKLDMIATIQGKPLDVASDHLDIPHRECLCRGLQWPGYDLVSG
jgi:hypothetical protein